MCMLNWNVYRSYMNKFLLLQSSADIIFGVFSEMLLITFFSLNWFIQMSRKILTFICPFCRRFYFFFLDFMRISSWKANTRHSFKCSRQLEEEKKMRHLLKWHICITRVDKLATTANLPLQLNQFIGIEYNFLIHSIVLYSLSHSRLIDGLTLFSLLSLTTAYSFIHDENIKLSFWSW